MEKGLLKNRRPARVARQAGFGTTKRFLQSFGLGSLADLQLRGEAAMSLKVENSADQTAPIH